MRYMTKHVYIFRVAYITVVSLSLQLPTTNQYTTNHVHILQDIAHFMRDMSTEIPNKNAQQREASLFHCYVDFTNTLFKTVELPLVWDGVTLVWMMKCFNKIWLHLTRHIDACHVTLSCYVISIFLPYVITIFISVAFWGHRGTN